MNSSYRLLTFQSSFISSVSLWNPQTSIFSNFFIKNKSYGTIYTFKNYFTTVFSVFNFSKISSIQINPKLNLFKVFRESFYCTLSILFFGVSFGLILILWQAKEAGSTRFCMGAAWRDTVRRKTNFNQILEYVKEIR